MNESLEQNPSPEPDSPFAENPMTCLQSIFELLDQPDDAPLRQLIHDQQPCQLADILEALPPDARKRFWAHIPGDKTADTLAFLHDEVRYSLIEAMSEEKLVEAAVQMDADDLVDFIEDLPEPVRENLQENLSDAIKEHLETSFSFAEGTAGRLLSPDVITVRGEVTLAVVKRYLKFHQELPEYTDGLMVVDRQGHYLGKLMLNAVLTNNDDKLVTDVMSVRYAPILASTEEHEIAQIFTQSQFVSAPVVDDGNILLGRMTMDDVIDILQAEADHNLLGRAGLDEDEDLFAPIFSSAKRRSIWLGINLITAFLAAWVIGLYAQTLEKIVALAVLMPIVASMGGIAGSQTLTLAIRGLALGQISSGNRLWLSRKEVVIGVINGLIWAVVVAGIAWLWFDNPGISLVIAAAIVINLIAAAAAGIAVPILLHRFGIDPALSGSVVLTTVTDVVGFMSFLGLATFFLL